jgi:2-keto-4-pentenoate hydratase/2-oxohepta-3-ene-1,7-dioic acid hydratase in catechol pathway
MHLARVRCDGDVRLCAVQGDHVRLLQHGALGVDQASPLGVAALATAGWSDAVHLPLESARALTTVELLAPVPRPEKIICVGLNYRRHAAEAGVSVPNWPEIFAKFPNSIADPGADIAIPAVDADVDYEVELCVVIGQRVSQLRAGNGLGAVGGYMAANDVSARRWQSRVSQWVSGKTSDGFCPIGPWMATPQTIADPQNLRLWSEVNGQRRQDSSTADMVFTVDQLVVYLSSLMTLASGDLIMTGTPEGVGLGRRPPEYLNPGDVVKVGVDGIGMFSNTFVPANHSAGLTRPTDDHREPASLA